METNKQSLIGALEAILFVSGEPLSFGKISKTLAISEKETEQLTEMLRKRYEDNPDGGLQLVMDKKRVLLATKGMHANIVETLAKAELQESLSKAGLEVLSIIAYKSPVTRADIESIRGVNCSFTLRNLLLRGLIEREGNIEDGRGYVYRPTLQFLQTLGVGRVEDLPDFESLSKDERVEALLTEESENSDGENIRQSA